MSDYDYQSDPGRRLREVQQKRGFRGPDDLCRLATSGATTIWRTDNLAGNDPPMDTPHYSYVDSTVEPELTYFPVFRGFDVEQLGDVLSAGIDVPVGAPFFADSGISKPWEYPAGRSIAAVAVFNPFHTERSFVRAPDDADASWRPDPAKYPHRNDELYTMFDMTLPNHSPGAVSDEVMYGYAIIGDPRAALDHVFLGGPEARGACPPR